MFLMGGQPMCHRCLMHGSVLYADVITALLNQDNAILPNEHADLMCLVWRLFGPCI